MGLHNKIYIGHVETVNMDSYGNTIPLESKVIVLKGNGKQEFRPLRKYSEYYKLSSIEPLNGILSNSKINKIIKNTGKQEVKVLNKVC